MGRCWLLGLEVGVGVCLGSLGLVWQHVSCSQLIRKKGPKRLENGSKLAKIEPFQPLFSKF